MNVPCILLSLYATIMHLFANHFAFQILIQALAPAENNKILLFFSGFMQTALMSNSCAYWIDKCGFPLDTFKAWNVWL